MMTCFYMGFILGSLKGEDECLTLGVVAPGENDYSNSSFLYS